MEKKLKILLEELRKDCNGKKCDTCKLGKDVIMRTAGSEYDICSMLTLIEKELGMID